jgi:hypothetical protein
LSSLNMPSLELADLRREVNRMLTLQREYLAKGSSYMLGVEDAAHEEVLIRQEMYERFGVYD